MATYKYYFTDLLTGALIDELPLFGVYFKNMINGHGDFTGTIRMDTHGYRAQDILDATRPGRTVVWVERDDRPIWCGIIWTRTYASVGRTMQLYAATHTSYMKQRVYTTDKSWTTMTASNIILDIWRDVTSGSTASIGVVIPADFSNPPGAIVSKSVVGLEYVTVDSVIKSLQDLEGGPEVYTRPFIADFGARSTRLMISDTGTGTRLGKESSSSNLTFQYPGNIHQYWWPENASRGATSLYAIGKAQDVSTPRDTATGTQTSEGYPLLSRRLTYPTAETTAQVTSRVNADLARFHIPVIAPTFEILGEDNIQFPDWELGDHFDFVLNDPWRFPQSAKWTDRIVGWELRPGDSDGPARLAFALGKEDLPNE